jgi:hypothetical protein
MVSALSPLAEAASSISYSSPSIFLKRCAFFQVSVVLWPIKRASSVLIPSPRAPAAQVWELARPEWVVGLGALERNGKDCLGWREAFEAVEGSARRKLNPCGAHTNGVASSAVCGGDWRF